MQGAALGLTCKDAFQVFSQNETLALQAQVNELKTLLAHHRPPITRAADKIQPRALQDVVCAVFDEIHHPYSRLAPVASEDEAYDPMRSIWSICGQVEDDLAQNSLQVVIMQVLKNALGDMSADYCTKQSHKAITAVRLALLVASTASGWLYFSRQQMQENIVWQTIGEHFMAMQVELEEWDNQSCWF